MEDYKKMEAVLYEVLSSYNWKSDFEAIMREFFTDAERKMFSKRVFVMYLLFKEVPHRDIAYATGISTSTISRYILLLSREHVKLKTIFSRVEKKERLINLFDDLFNTIFVQPGLYRNHWRMYIDYQKRKKKRDTSGV